MLTTSRQAAEPAGSYLSHTVTGFEFYLAGGPLVETSWSPSSVAHVPDPFVCL